MDARLAVVVGRFQVPELHPGHHHLLTTATTFHARLLVVLGDHGGLPTDRYPLPFEVRAAMIRQAYPDAIIVRLCNMPSDTQWCASLDALIAEHAGDDGAVLYGSRDSFLSCYAGKFPTMLVKELPGFSGTKMRECDATCHYGDVSFRAGIIHAQALRLPVSYQTVDVAILSDDRTKVLLGQKPMDDGMWRFVGGFVDPTDATLESAARREAKEECGDIEISDPHYVGSFRINDVRYAHAQDKIMTAFFSSTYVYGRVAAGDDITLVAWHPVERLLDILAPGHRILGQALLATINTTNE